MTEKSSIDAKTNRDNAIVRIVREHFPHAQAIYLFGSCATGEEWPDSDIDIGLLLPPNPEAAADPMSLNLCGATLADCLRKKVDLVDVRQVSTVMQKEVIAAGRMLFCMDQYAVDEFEMLVLSYYQKLNEERRELLDAFAQTGRAYGV